MKMKKIVALVTASALCLGMSMTVLADYSIDESDLVGNRGLQVGDVTNANPNGDYEVGLDDITDGTLQEIIQKFVNEYRARFPKETEGLSNDEIAAQIEANPTMKKAIENEVNAVLDVFRDRGEGNQERLNIFKKNGYVVPSDDVEAIVLATADLTATWKNGKEMTDKEFKERFPNGMTQQINVGSLLGYKTDDLGIGDTIYVLHLDVATGNWETIPATVKSVGGDAWIEVTFKSLSPIGIVKVMSNNKVIALDKAGKPITDGNGNIPVLNDPNKTNNSKTNNSMTSNAKNTTTTTTLGKSPKTGEF